MNPQLQHGIWKCTWHTSLRTLTTLSAVGFGRLFFVLASLSETTLPDGKHGYYPRVVVTILIQHDDPHYGGQLSLRYFLCIWIFDEREYCVKEFCCLHMFENNLTKINLFLFYLIELTPQPFRETISRKEIS